MTEDVQEATHTYLRKGEPVRKENAQHQLPYRDLTNVFDMSNGNEWSDAKGLVVNGQKTYLLITGTIYNHPSETKKVHWKRNNKHIYGIVNSRPLAHLDLTVDTNYVLVEKGLIERRQKPV